MATSTTTRKARPPGSRSPQSDRGRRPPSSRSGKGLWTEKAAADWHEWSVVERLGWWAVVLATFGVTTVFFKWGPNAFDVPKLALLWSCVWVAIAGVIASLLTGRLTLVRLRVRWALVAFVAIQILATVFAISPRLSLFGNYGRYMGLIPLLLYVCLMLAACCYCAMTPGLVRHLLVAVGATSIIGSLVAVLEPLGFDLDFKTSTNYTGTSVGLQGNSDFSAGVIAIGFSSLLVLRVVADQRWMRVVATAGLPLSVVGLYLLNSRGAIIALVVGIAVTGLMSRETVPRLMTLGAVAGIGLILIVLLSLGATRAGAFAGRTDNVPLLRSESFVQRIDIWRGVVGVVTERPVLGGGPDSLDLTFPSHQPGELTLRPATVDTAHDVFLQYGAGSGVLGMAAYATLIGWAIIQAVRNRDRFEGPRRLLLAGALGTFSTYMAQAIFSIDELQLAVLGWVSLGMVLGLSDSGSLAIRASQVPRERRPMPVGASFGLSSLAVVLTVVAAVPVVADARFNAAWNIGEQFSLGLRDATTLRRSFEEAEAFNPLEVTYRAEAARWALQAPEKTTTEERARLLEWAEAQLDSALVIQPRQRELLMRKARVLDHRAKLGELSLFDQAEELYQQLIAQDPNDAKARVERTFHLENWYRMVPDPLLIEEARKEARAIENVKYLFPKGWCQVSSTYTRLGDHQDALRTARRCAELSPEDPSVKQKLAEAEQRARS